MDSMPASSQFKRGLAIQGFVIHIPGTTQRLQDLRAEQLHSLRASSGSGAAKQQQQQQRRSGHGGGRELEVTALDWNKTGHTLAAAYGR
jgi:hypothetical protein